MIVQGDSERKTLTYEIVWIKNYDRNIDATDLTELVVVFDERLDPSTATSTLAYTIRDRLLQRCLRTPPGCDSPYAEPSFGRGSPRR